MNAIPDPNQAPRPTGVDYSATQPAVTDSLTEVPGVGDPVRSSEHPPPLAKWLVVYTLLRLGTLVVLTAVLSLLMPLILALLFAVVLALPLSWVLFGGVRRRVNEAMAVSTAARRGERERLRAALDGRDGS